MASTRTTLVILGFLAGMVVCVPLRADFWDEFSDGYFARDTSDPRYDANDPNWTDPNNNVLRDIDNPDWFIGQLISGAPYLVEVISDTVADKAVRMWTDRHWMIPLGAVGLGVDDGDYDPNTSATYWDDRTDHYILAWVYYTGYYSPQHSDPRRRYSYLDPLYDPNYDDPNEDRGYLALMMHVDDANWTGLMFMNAFNTFKAWFQLPRLWAVKSFAFGGENYRTFRELYTDTTSAGWSSYPNVPTSCMHMEPYSVVYEGPNLGGQNIDVWERTGYWWLLQFEREPGSAPGDPNGKSLRAAIWHGDKYDWDGKWILGGPLTGWWKDPMPQSACDPNWYRSGGKMYLLMTSSEETDNWGVSELNGFPAEAAVDHIEVRTGKFDKNPCRLMLSVVKPNYGAISINPDLRDPADPNTSEEKVLRYTRGTGVVLQAVPIAGKSFSEWSVWSDPNRYPDANYITIRDSNAVLYLVMDHDYLAEATFKCGSGLPPFIAAAFLALAAGVAFRMMSAGRVTRRHRRSGTA